MYMLCYLKRLIRLHCMTQHRYVPVAICSEKPSPSQTSVQKGCVGIWCCHLPELQTVS